MKCIVHKAPCRAYIALGSNLHEPKAQVLQAFQDLGLLPQTRLIACSSLYLSAPVGYMDQPAFINAVAEIETSLAPHALLDALLELEHKRGRVREVLNGPRTLDLDVLLYDELQCHEHGLTLPHPRMYERAFVLKPLLEIAPDCTIPGQGKVALLLDNCTNQVIERVTDNG